MGFRGTKNGGEGTGGVQGDTVEGSLQVVVVTADEGGSGLGLHDLQRLVALGGIKCLCNIAKYICNFANFLLVFTGSTVSFPRNVLVIKFITSCSLRIVPNQKPTFWSFQ